MSALSDALADLEAKGLLDRVTKLDLGKDRTTVEVLPKIAVMKPGKQLPGATDDDVLFDAS